MSDPIVQDLERLTREGGDGNRLVLSCAHAWLVFLGQRGSRQVRCEAAASFYLPKEHRLSPERVHLLRQAGFSTDASGRNLARNYELGGLHHPVKVADDAREIFRSVYGCDPDQPGIEHTLVLGDLERTDNPGLMEAIREMARRRDQETRHAMYRQMLRARFLLPKDEAGSPRGFGELAGWPVFGVFTDWEALRRWDPRGAPYEVMGGRQLFPMMARISLGSLLINPGGRVGGELYRNEVETLAAAVR